MSEELSEYILEEQKKGFNEPNSNDFISKLKIGDKVLVLHFTREKHCTVRKVIDIKLFPKSFDIKLNNNKWYRDGIEIYEVHSQYSCASEYLMELTEELNELLGDSCIKEYELEESKSTNQYELVEKRVKGAYLTKKKDAEINEEEIDIIVEAYNELSDIEKHVFKSIIRFDEKSARLVELLEEVKKLENAILTM